MFARGWEGCSGTIVSCQIGGGARYDHIAGDGAAAGKALAEGKRYEEQVRLGEELKRLQGS